MRPVSILVPRMPTTDLLVPYLDRIEKTRQYSNFGPLNNELISRVSAISGVHVSGIATAANATLALQGLVSTSNVPLAESWYAPAWTFTATASAILQANANLQFVDIDDENNAFYPPDAKYLVEVWPFGLRSKTSSHPPGARRVIVDAAAGFDSITDFIFDNDLPTAVVVSLHATKLLGAGEGAFIITNDASWATRFKAWTNFGISEGRISSFLGTNAKLNEYSAAVALASLDLWDKTKSEFSNISMLAREISRKYSLTPYMSLNEDFITPYWILKFESASEKEILVEIAKELLIQTRDWWARGCHEMPAYRDIPHSSLINTREIAGRTIGLPFHTYLTTEDWDRIENLFATWTYSVKFNR